MNSAPVAASHWRTTWRRFRRQRVAMIALAFIVIVIVMAVFAPIVATHHPVDDEDFLNRFAGPSSDHLLGTDDLGRDTFSRLVYGARTTMLISVVTVLISSLIAVPVGLASGYFSGKVDVIVMRVVDAVMSIPPLVLALAVAGILGPGTRNLIIALIVVIVPGFVRLVRGTALAVREEGYVEASRAIGTKPRVVMLRRVLPHALSPLLVQVSVALGTIIVVEASLSYLGLGSPPPNASWGSMLKDGFTLMAIDVNQILIPGITIALTTLAFNAIGDGLRDAVTGSGQHRRQSGDALGITSVPVPEVAARLASAAGGTGGGERALLSIRNLTVGFDTPGGLVRVVENVDLDVRRGEVLGVVGESGCGKTVTAQSILRLLPSPPARILSGEIRFEGRDLLRCTNRQMRDIRGRDIAMIFQDPMASLNPAFTIGDQIVEAQRLHAKVTKSAARSRAVELLDLVGIPDARRRLDDYPHTFSGGMRQRALIAMALANRPKLLIADEPTTALDVTVQAQILELLRDLRDAFDMSVLFVTHDLGVVQELCDRVVVMYAGQVVETAPVTDVFSRPQHPYTTALLESRPRLGGVAERLTAIPGIVPAPGSMPTGCRFQDRCPMVGDECRHAPVDLVMLGDERAARCVLVGRGEPDSPLSAEGAATS